MAGKSEDSVSISVPYRNLRKDVEVEMVTKHGNERASSSSSSSSSSSPLNGSDGGEPVAKDCSLVTLVLSCTVAAGVQFGWALQLSLLTPYIQVSFVAAISCRLYEEETGDNNEV
ncbi:hypothetical protein F2Q68_00036153 [Brassica cretica]|uniref:Uncharacterized protein n=1 Tax=Brassica cretica TaxID=69181 RepID=A0A8S9H0D1_BRACR|nr:hypothetical protein F2Q68_00036153 [Brassica cretica]